MRLGISPYKGNNMLKRLLTGFILAICTLSGVNSAELQSSRHFENSGGLVDHISPLLVPEKSATSIQNITLDDRGQLSKRNGYDILNTTGALGTSAVFGGAYHDPASGSDFFAIVVGTSVFRTGNTFAGTYENATPATGLTITNSAGNLAQSTSLNDRVVFCNEVDKPFTVRATGNAVQISTSTISAAKTCTTYGLYLVLANTTESSTAFPSRIRWSDVNNTEAFPANNFIDVEPNDGDKIVALLTFDDSVYVFKKRSIHRLLITGLDGAEAFVVRPVARNIGAWAKMSVKVIPNLGITFLAQDTVYVLNDDGLSPIGDSIQRSLETVSRLMWANAVAEVYPAKYQYWLAMSEGGTVNNVIFVYDYIQKAWTVYRGMNVGMLAQAEDSNGNNILLSGDYAGNHYKQDTGTSDMPANVTTAISAYYTTADVHLGSPEITKNFKYLYLFTLVDATTTVTIDAFYDYDATAIAYTSDLSLGQNGAVYDVAIYDQDIYPNQQYKVSRIELNRSARAIKLKFSNSSADALVGVIGWVLVYNLEDYRQ